MPRLTPKETKAIFKFYVYLNEVKKPKLLPYSKGIADCLSEFVSFA